jgi:hypothetical protein
LHLCVDGDYARSSGIDRQRRNLIAGYFRVGNCLARGFRQCPHVIVMTLRGEIGIVFAAVQWIFGNAAAKAAARRVYDRHADTESSKIDAGNNGHFASPDSF